MKAALTILSVLVAFLIATLPLASAASVRIVFNGQEQGSPIQLSPTNAVSRTITIDHDPADITWSRVRVKFDVLSADPSSAPTQILLYKCKRQGPSECIRTTPLTFDRYIDGDIAWTDVSERDGTAQYPQTANFLTLVRLESNGASRWLGLWDVVTRSSYNTFTVHNTDAGEIQATAKSIDLIPPIRSFISTRQMLPLSWLSSVSFPDSSQLISLAGDAADFGTRNLQASRLASTAISSSNKDFLLAVAETPSAFANPITLNRNPSFAAGDGVCETDLGESSSVSCVDCGCAEGSYCDAATAAAAGSCRLSSAISLDTGTEVTHTIDCTKPFRPELTVRVVNPPASLPPTTTAVATIAGAQYRTTCTLAEDTYSCPVQLKAPAACGTDTATLTGNAIALTLAYNDGRQRVTRSLQAAYPDILVQYDCACAQGSYCDIGKAACAPDSSLSLSVLSVESYITDYEPTNNLVRLVARINNPPTDLAVEQVRYTFGNITLTGGSSVEGYTGTVTCVAEGTQFSCDLPLTVANYDHANQYVIRANSLRFSVRYSDAARTVSRDLTSAFSDITIPSYRCGDGVVNPEETQASCCLDVGCSAGAFCDSVRSCQPVNSLSLSVETATPTELTDCTLEHPVTIVTQVANAPTGLTLDRATFSSGGSVRSWPLSCSPNGYGLFTCTLRVPPQACAAVSQSPTTTLSANQISLAVRFPDGTKAPLTQTLTAAVPDLVLTPAFHVADGTCETDAGESAANSCSDCPCGTDPAFGSDYYCNIDPAVGAAGACVLKSSISLELLKPTAPVRFDSCEHDNDVNIQVEVKNPPAQLQLTGAQAALNGEAADLFFCEPQEFLGKPVGSFYNCSLTIPSSYTCERGVTVRYPAAENKLAFTFQFPNGQRSFETTTKNATLPEISITQRVRSLYDITNDAMKQIKGKLREVMKTARDLLKWQKTCVQLLTVFSGIMMAAVVAVPAVQAAGGNVGTSIVGAGAGATVGTLAAGPLGGFVLGAAGGIGAGIYGGSSGSFTAEGPQNAKTIEGWARNNPNTWTDPDTKNTYYFAKDIPAAQDNLGQAVGYTTADGKFASAQPVTQSSTMNWGQSLQAVAAAGQVVLGAFSEMCKMISEQYKMNIQVQQMEVQFIQMQLCMDIAQHQMDTGECNRPGAAQQCFDRTVGCVNFGAINDGLNNVLQSTNNIAASAQRIGQLTQTGVNVLTPLLSSAPAATVAVRCGGRATDACCGYTVNPSYAVPGRFTGGTTPFVPAELEVVLVEGATSCRDQGRSLWLALDGAHQPGGLRGLAPQIFQGQPSGDHSITVYCGQPGIIQQSTALTTYSLHYCQGDAQQGCWQTNGDPTPLCASVWSSASARQNAPALPAAAPTTTASLATAATEITEALAILSTPPISQKAAVASQSLTTAQQKLQSASAASPTQAKALLEEAEASLGNALTTVDSLALAELAVDQRIAAKDAITAALSAVQSTRQQITSAQPAQALAIQTFTAPSAIAGQPVPFQISVSGTAPFRYVIDCNANPSGGAATISAGNFNPTSTAPAQGLYSGPSTAPAVSCTFQTAGTYTILLDVADNNLPIDNTEPGRTAKQTLVVTATAVPVPPTPPAAPTLTPNTAPKTPTLTLAGNAGSPHTNRNNIPTVTVKKSSIPTTGSSANKVELWVTVEDDNGDADISGFTLQACPAASGSASCIQSFPIANSQVATHTWKILVDPVWHSTGNVGSWVLIDYKVNAKDTMSQFSSFSAPFAVRYLID